MNFFGIDKSILFKLFEIKRLKLGFVILILQVSIARYISQILEESSSWDFII